LPQLNLRKNAKGIHRSPGWFGKCYVLAKRLFPI